MNKLLKNTPKKPSSIYFWCLNFLTWHTQMNTATQKQAKPSKGRFLWCWWWCCCQCTVPPETVPAEALPAMSDGCHQQPGRSGGARKPEYLCPVRSADCELSSNDGVGSACQGRPDERCSCHPGTDLQAWYSSLDPVAKLRWIHQQKIHHSRMPDKQQLV